MDHENFGWNTSKHSITLHLSKKFMTVSRLYIFTVDRARYEGVIIRNQDGHSERKKHSSDSGYFSVTSIIC